MAGGIVTAFTLLGTAIAPGVGTVAGAVVGDCVGGTIRDAITSDLKGEEQTRSAAARSCLGGAVTAGIAD